MIEVENLHKSYGSVRALRDVSFSIAPGEIVGLLGPNGAGKTTIIKTLTGYLQPDRGRVHIDDLDVLTHTQEVQSRIGYLPENAPLYPELSVQSYLRMIAGLRQIAPEKEDARLSDAIVATGLAQHLTRPIGQLSKGFRQRVGLAQAILHDPRLLILDEPTVGLDPVLRRDLWNLFRRLSQEGRTVLVSSHVMDEATRCDRLLLIRSGQILSDSTLPELLARTGTEDAESAFLALIEGSAA